jgi:hypothetical protein
MEPISQNIPIQPERYFYLFKMMSRKTNIVHNIIKELQVQQVSSQKIKVLNKLYCNSSQKIKVSLTIRFLQREKRSMNQRACFVLSLKV